MSRKNSPFLQIEIETTDLITKTKKDGSSTYQVQTAYVHVLDRDGKPKRYPEEISLFPPRTPQGDVSAYEPGNYTLAPQSFNVDRGFLNLNFPSLIPISNV